MKCATCGYYNKNPRFEAVLFPVEHLPYDTEPCEMAVAAPVRWACGECGRYHFRDGTPYDHEKAMKLHLGKGHAP